MWGWGLWGHHHTHNLPFQHLAFWSAGPHVNRLVSLLDIIGPPWPQWISESLKMDWQAPPVNRLGVRYPLLLSADKCLTLWSLCHGHTCHNIVLFIHIVGWLFQWKLCVDQNIVFVNLWIILTAGRSTLPPLNIHFEWYWCFYIGACTPSDKSHWQWYKCKYTTWTWKESHWHM